MSRAPDRHPPGARQSIAAAMLSVFVIAMVAVPTHAQESAATQSSEDGTEHVENALVARFALPAEALNEVASSVEIPALEPTVIGRFELTGWRPDGQTRGATVEITGTFDAAPAEP